MRSVAFAFASLFLCAAAACSGHGTPGTDGPDGDEPPARYLPPL